MRRTDFIASLTALTAAPAVAAAQTPAPTTIRIASAPDEDIVGALWGVESGAFRKVGLDVQVSRANSGSAVAAAVAGGSLDIGKSSLVSLMAARNRGLPFLLVAPSGIYTAENPVVGMIVAKNAPYKTGKDMNGKTLGVQALNDLNGLAMDTWIDKNGGDSSTVKFV
jgi:NitT/TauT family transport system substrate-binding protein